MASILISLFTFFLVLISFVLIMLILMQRANTNAGLGTAFGGGLAESAFGAHTGDMLSKLTIILVTGFFLLSFGLYLAQITQEQGSDDSVKAMTELKIEATEEDSGSEGAFGDISVTPEQKPTDTQATAIETPEEKPDIEEEVKSLPRIPEEEDPASPSEAEESESEPSSPNTVDPEQKENPEESDTGSAPDSQPAANEPEKDPSSKEGS